MDELDDLLNQHAELEARFKELEDRVDLEELKAEVQWAEHELRSGRSPTSPEPTRTPGPVIAPPSSTGAPQVVEIDDADLGVPQARSTPAGPHARVSPVPSSKPPGPAPTESKDPTAALKARLDGREDVLFLVVLCPRCDGKNRTRLDRLRSAVPRCGRCGGDLTRMR